MEPGGAGERRRRLQGLRREAAEYYRGQGVPQRLEEALNALFPRRPADLYGEMANYFTKLSKVPVICKVVGRKVLDGVGLPTLEVEIHCTVKNYEKRICSIIVPSHFQIPDNALPETNEDDEKERNSSVNTAVKWVNESLDTMLRDLKPTDQCEVDKMLGVSHKGCKNKSLEQQKKKCLDMFMRKAPFKKFTQCQFNSVGMFFQTVTPLLFIALWNISGTEGLCVSLLH